MYISVIPISCSVVCSIASVVLIHLTPTIVTSMYSAAHSVYLSKLLPPPHTHAQVQTRLSYRSGVMTWLVCAGIFLVLCFFTGFLGVIGIVAFCIDDLKDVYHLDPAGNVVGVYKRI